jgi:hypothetical protein
MSQLCHVESWYNWLARIARAVHWLYLCNRIEPISGGHTPMNGE